MEVPMRERDLARAAEKYLEQYGEPLVMNTYLKITVLALLSKEKSYAEHGKFTKGTRAKSKLLPDFSVDVTTALSQKP